MPGSKRRKLTEQYAALLQEDSDVGGDSDEGERLATEEKKKKLALKKKKKRSKRKAAAAAAGEGAATATATATAAAPAAEVDDGARAAPQRTKPNRIQRKAPTVIEFDDPTAKAHSQTQFEKKAKGRFMSAAVSKVHTVVVPSIANENDSDDQNDMDLNVITADILRLGASQMNAKDRRKWQTQQMVDLGARGPKNSKMPISMLNGMRSKQKQRAQRKKDYDIASGMYRKPSEKKEAAAPSRGLGTRWKDNSTLEDKRFRNGTLYIKRT